MSVTQNIPQIDVLSILTRDRVRLLREGETIPANLEAGFEQLGELDCDWVWVIESCGEIKGVLLASPCHGTAAIWRLSLDPELEQVAVLRLLRRFLGDLKSRGLRGYLTLIDPSKPVHAKLKSIMEKVGAEEFGPYTMMVGPTPQEFI